MASNSPARRPPPWQLGRRRSKRAGTRRLRLHRSPSSPRSARWRPGQRERNGAPHRPISIFPRSPPPPRGASPRRPRFAGFGCRLRRGDIDQQQYDDEIDRLITDAVHWQEEAGLDVLVHGEFERTDMVEFFGERMDGFLTTNNGWVNSYGSRCVRPPDPGGATLDLRADDGARMAGGSGGHRQAGEGDAHRAGDHRQLELPPPRRARRQAVLGGRSTHRPRGRATWSRRAHGSSRSTSRRCGSGGRSPTADAEKRREVYSRGVQGGAGEGVRRTASGATPHPHVLRRLRRHRPAVGRCRGGRGLGGVLPVEGRELHPALLRPVRRRPPRHRARGLRRPQPAQPRRGADGGTAPPLPRVHGPRRHLGEPRLRPQDEDVGRGGSARWARWWAPPEALREG